MTYKQAEEKVLSKSDNLPSEAIPQLIDEEFGITNYYYSCNAEVEGLKRSGFDFMRNTGMTNIDPQRELDFSNRE